jgi:hypothetical protein
LQFCAVTMTIQVATQLEIGLLEIINDTNELKTTARKYDIDKMTLLRFLRKYKIDTNTYNVFAKF